MPFQATVQLLENVPILISIQEPRVQGFYEITHRVIYAPDFILAGNGDIFIVGPRNRFIMLLLPNDPLVGIDD